MCIRDRGTNGHLSIIEPDAYFSDYLPAAGQYRREGKTHWAEVMDSTDTQARYRKLLALEQAANGTDVYKRQVLTRGRHSPQ